MTQFISNSDIGGEFREFYYLVDDQQKTLSRYQAMLWAGGDINRIRFYFMDDVWDGYDLTAPPTETFEELCVQRCRDLRDRYDWLCLWLSAGYDSNTVLDSFIRAGIAIDEIAYMDRLYFPDVEKPFIEEAAASYKKYHNPRVRITRLPIDHSYTFDFYRQHGEDWILQPGALPRFSKSTAAMIQSFNENVVRNKLSTPGRRADIYGKEKPRVDLEDGYWYMKSPDQMMEDNLGGVNVNFYTCSEFPKLYVKQCHMAIDWFETITDGPIQPEHVQGIQWSNAGYYMDWNLACGRIPVASHLSAHAITKHLYTRDSRSPDSLSMLNQIKSDEKDLYYTFQRPLWNLYDTITKISGQEKFNLDARIWSKKWPIRPYIHRPVL